jgi:hypothetical protein
LFLFLFLLSFLSSTLVGSEKKTERSCSSAALVDGVADGPQPLPGGVAHGRLVHGDVAMGVIVREAIPPEPVQGVEVKLPVLSAEERRVCTRTRGRGKV